MGYVRGKVADADLRLRRVHQAALDDVAQLADITGKRMALQRRKSGFGKML